MVFVRGVGYGGTTTLATANAVRQDAELQAIGLCLDPEFDELGREIPISTDHVQHWRTATRTLFDICTQLSLTPKPTPKMVDYTRCLRCGRCILGCPTGAKWDSRSFLATALQRGAQLLPGWSAERVVISHHRAEGVVARQGWKRRFYPADLIILAAGGFGTPVILAHSGIPCEPRLFVDPVLCVAAPVRDVYQNREIPMPFVVQRDGFIISPYFDFLSFFFDRRWRFPAKDMLVLMIKLADTNAGTVTGKRITKTLTAVDKERLQAGISLCREILVRFGADAESIFLGTLNAGHPGGMLPLSELEASTLHHDRLPENLFVADATLFPTSLGNPPILTIMALAKRISRICM
jgi:ferredoxin